MPVLCSATSGRATKHAAAIAGSPLSRPPPRWTRSSDDLDRGAGRRPAARSVDPGRGRRRVARRRATVCASEHVRAPRPGAATAPSGRGRRLARRAAACEPGGGRSGGSGGRRPASAGRGTLRRRRIRRISTLAFFPACGVSCRARGRRLGAGALRADHRPIRPVPPAGSARRWVPRSPRARGGTRQIGFVRMFERAR